MPGDAVKFGEAYVEVHAKLDAYEREIAEAERRSTAATRRVEASAAGGGSPRSSVSLVGHAAEAASSPLKSLGSLVGHVVKSFLLWKFLPQIIMAVGQAARWSAVQVQLLEKSAVAAAARIPLIGPGMARGITLLAPAVTTSGRAIGTLAAPLSGLARLFNTVTGAAVRFGSWGLRAVGAGVTAATASVAAIAGVVLYLGDIIDGLKALPDLAARAAKAIGRFAADAYEATVGRAARKTTSMVNSWFGGENYYEQEVAARKRDEEMARRQRAMEEMSGRFRSSSALDDAAKNARRQRSLVGLEGADLERRQGLFREQDILEQARQDVDRIASELKAVRADLQNQLKEESISEVDFKLKNEVANRLSDDAIIANERKLADALVAAKRETAARVAEAEKRTALERADELQDLQDQLARARAELEMEGADAQAEAIRIAYRTQIARAERDGSAERVALLQQLAQAQIAAVRKAEQERWKAQTEEMDRGARDVRDRVGDVQRRIERARMETTMKPGSERDLALEVFDIDTDAGDQVREAQRQIEELKKKQEAIRDDWQKMLSDKGFEEFNALGEQIKLQEELIGKLKEEQQARIALAQQKIREAQESQQFAQVDARDLGRRPSIPVAPGLGGAAGAGGGAPVTTQADQLKEQKLSRDELIAIRRALEHGVPAYAN